MSLPYQQKPVEQKLEIVKEAIEETVSELRVLNARQYRTKEVERRTEELNDQLEGLKQELESIEKEIHVKQGGALAELEAFEQSSLSGR